MKMKKRKKLFVRKSAPVILGLYILLSVGYFAVMHYGLAWLEAWLTDYEAAQPDVKSREVFEQLFSQPDWEALYRQAGLTDTKYESAEHYSAYMSEKIGTEQLQYHETSAGLSGDKKYIVKAGEEKVAEFTLTAEEHSATDIPDWQLGSVALFPVYAESVTVCTAPGRTVYVNGVELGEDHVIQTMHTLAEAYLPENTNGMYKNWCRETGFLIEPEISVVDTEGRQIELYYDAAADLYTEQFPEMIMPQEEQDWLYDAATLYCEYMIGAQGHYPMRSCIDDDEEIWKIITTGSKWMQGYIDYRFGEATFQHYYRYSETHFSVKLTMSLFVTRYDHTEKEYPLDSTFLVRRDENGRWKIYDIVNMDLQDAVTQVRLTYVYDGQVLASEMVDTHTENLVPPVIAAPEGQVLSGWYVQQLDETGRITYALAFVPGEDGTLQLDPEQPLQPMTLYALFGNA